MAFNSPVYKRDDTTHHGVLVSQSPVQGMCQWTNGPYHRSGSHPLSGLLQPSPPLIIGPSSSVKLYVPQYLTNISVCQGHTGCQCSNLYINLAGSKNGHNKFQGVIFPTAYEQTEAAVFDSPQKGESSLSRSMIGGSFSIIKSMSSSVL
jgi:hypothetical protein